MRKIYLLALCSLSAMLTQAQPAKKIAIIPEPVEIQENAGKFILPHTVIIKATTGKEVEPVVDYLRKRLTTATDLTVTSRPSSALFSIKLLLNNSDDVVIGQEGYHLSVTKNHVIITANKPAGLFYGVQTLMQLLPKEIESQTPVKQTWEIPCVTITDYPRFEWRGLMFDVSRHFFGKEDVKHYIDDMVRYKYNLLHLHLTDDEGWRIEIKSLPKLTQIGAYRVYKVGYFGTFSPPEPNEPRNYGGFYTQDDIRELVQYAKERFVNILPEIDVPGHSLAAIAAYPELASTPDAVNYHVRSGEPIRDWSKKPFPALIDNNLNPASENTYQFLDKVITEVAQLFPFPYIHMGGDEAAKNFWEQSEAVKALMQRENLKNQEEVQSYFEKRVEKIVESKGKRFMGWDEILEGGLAPNAAVMSWRGLEGGKMAAQQKHDVVMSPTDFAYLDYMQGDVALEPKVYATLRLAKAYQFEPVPEGVDTKYIKGGQANLWTEQVYNMRHAEYMTYPRAFAIAEDLWTPKARKNWNDFFGRVEDHFERFKVADIKYAPSVYDPIITPGLTRTNEVQVTLATEVPGLDIYYTFDNSFPDNHYPKYESPLVVPKDAAMLRIITYRNGQQIGRLITIPVTDLNKRAGKK
ncbi:family 20 glycosylhydrolase [Mucilaginibacter sp. RS28]|uniref:beta-N-acetylhexosaminidase n=1 Tax=Mucilaginibacter straminoryzae TaxID=2932774 RepID=A0A9X2BA14_9SPHI|nr:family 20 glycosylhydrolase [Mucilaginibacter straminoryzae]MCJ8208292.1 family 20 glycosylhydrolase [Mucilaginibacter straminoryzae]